MSGWWIVEEVCEAISVGPVTILCETCFERTADGYADGPLAYDTPQFQGEAFQGHRLDHSCSPRLSGIDAVVAACCHRSQRRHRRGIVTLLRARHAVVRVVAGGTKTTQNKKGKELNSR